MSKRTKRIMFRCSEDEYDSVKDKVNQLDTFKTMAGYVRYRALGFHIPSFSIERAKCLILINNLLRDLYELQSDEINERLKTIKQILL
ncbi:plasmid mobilization protein [Fulvivirga lutea]|uniref:Mobilization protein n=1 Tax=Fulvivirga lutea TaxID=2810512 RepID=A0A974WHT2_9BACT|nr:hypothetical protein [Fulvivirga lutea]QSE98641.1 hypothetical protein JR347_06065 [Fulvivirga lutea]